jgi:uncharacterized membrane protein
MKRIIYEWDKDIGPVVSVISGRKRYCACLCHHQPERSIHFLGIGRYLCARCLGICVGGIIAILALFLAAVPPLPLVAALAIPLILDGSFQFFSQYKSRNSIRLVTGILFGISVFFAGYSIPFAI